MRVPWTRVYRPPAGVARRGSGCQIARTIGCSETVCPLALSRRRRRLRGRGAACAAEGPTCPPASAGRRGGSWRGFSSAQLRMQRRSAPPQRMGDRRAAALHRARRDPHSGDHGDARRGRAVRRRHPQRRGEHADRRTRRPRHDRCPRRARVSRCDELSHARLRAGDDARWRRGRGRWRRPGRAGAREGRDPRGLVHGGPARDRRRAAAVQGAHPRA